MKTLKTIALISIVSVGMTSSVFASWWNPTTWKMFTRKNSTPQAQVTQHTIKATTSMAVTEQEGTPMSAPKEEIKITSQKNKEKDVLAKKIEQKLANKITESSAPKTIQTKDTKDESTTNTTMDDSVYDSNIMNDSLGRKVTITQTPNYKFTRVVKAKMEPISGGLVEGFFYKDSKTFMTEADLDLQAKMSQDKTDREFGRGIYSTIVTTSTPAPSSVKVYATPVNASYTVDSLDKISAPYGIKARTTISLRNTSDKIIEIRGLSYKIVTDNSYLGEYLPISIGDTSGLLERFTYDIGDNDPIKISFQRPIILFEKTSVNLVFDYGLKVKTITRGSSASTLSVSSIETSPDVDFVKLPIDIKAVYGY